MLAAVLLLVPVGGFSQTEAPSVLHWTEGGPNAGSDVKDGVKIENLKTDDVHIFVSLVDIKDTEYNRVWVQISNHGKAPIDFNPQSAVLLRGDKSVRAEAADKAANSIQKFGEAKSQELGSAKCNNMIATQCAANNSQIQLSKQVAAYSAQQAQWVRDNAVRQKTLAPGDEAQGAILFKKERKAADYTLRIPVGAQTFEFPLSAQNKAPSYD
jgi:hypothetical protein